MNSRSVVFSAPFAASISRFRVVSAPFEGIDGVLLPFSVYSPDASLTDYSDWLALTF